MRMKKIMIFAVAALTLAACSKTFDHNKVASEGNAIGFGTWAEQLTKVRTAGASTFGNGDSFKVEGFKTLAGSPVTVFDDVTVSTTDGSTWTYENTRFWDSNATSYTFFAVSSPNTALTFAADGTIAATTVTFSGENNDILLANSVPVLPANYKSDVPVALVFKHIGALVDLKVKKSAGLNTANATVAITGVTIEGVSDEATVAVTGYSTNVPTVAWASLANSDNSTYGITSGAVDCTLPGNVGTTGDDLINTLVVIPQELGDTKILKISYTITDAAGTVNTFTNKEIKLNLFDTTENTTNGSPDTPISEWVAGNHYIYTLTIDANTINFSATITDWTTAVNGYHYLLQ